MMYICGQSQYWLANSLKVKPEEYISYFMYVIKFSIASFTCRSVTPSSANIMELWDNCHLFISRNIGFQNNMK